MRRVIGIAVGLSVAGAAAASPATPADAAFASGLALMEKQDYAAACAAFEDSQRLDPQFGTELDLAVCYVKLHRVHAAWKLYSDVARGDRNAARAARAARAAEELWPRVPRLRLHVAGRAAGLHVAVDASDATALVDSELPLEVGHHAIEASSPGALPFHQDVELAAGERRDVDIVLEPRPPVAAASERAVEPVAPPPAAASSGHGWAWLTLGGGVALVGGGAAAAWHARQLDDEAHAACRPGQCTDPAAAQHLVDRARHWGDAATIAIATGAVALAGGVYLWRTSGKQPLRLDAAIGPSSTALVLGGAF